MPELPARADMSTSLKTTTVVNKSLLSCATPTIDFVKRSLQRQDRGPSTRAFDHSIKRLGRESRASDANLWRDSHTHAKPNRHQSMWTGFKIVLIAPIPATTVFSLLASLHTYAGH